MLARRADLELANQLVALVRIDRQLVAEAALAVLLGSTRLDILLAPLRRRPVDRHGVVLDDRFLFLVQRLPGHLHDARVDDLAPWCDVAVPGKLTVDRIEHALAHAGLDQPLLERPDRRAVWNLAGVGKPRETQKTHPIQQLEIHLFIGQIEQLLKQ